MSPESRQGGGVFLPYVFCSIFARTQLACRKHTKICVVFFLRLFARWSVLDNNAFPEKKKTLENDQKGPSEPRLLAVFVRWRVTVFA